LNESGYVAVPQGNGAPTSEWRNQQVSNNVMAKQPYGRLVENH